MLAAAAPKPACNAGTRGQIWPAGGSYAPGTTLEVCTMKVWKFRWEPVTVSYQDLVRAAESRMQGKEGRQKAVRRAGKDETRPTGDDAMRRAGDDAVRRAGDDRSNAVQIAQRD